MDGTSMVSAADATAANSQALAWVKTMVATVLWLSWLLITLFFGNRVIGLIKSAVSWH